MTHHRHTPGPWELHPYDPYIADIWNGEQIVCTLKPTPGSNQSIGNANLITAAPELLGALEWITRCGFMRGPAGTTAYFISDERMAAARAAVARAKGVPPAPLPESVRGELLTVLEEIAERADSNAADLDPELDAHGGFIRIRDDALAAVAKAKGNL